MNELTASEKAIALKRVAKFWLAIAVVLAIVWVFIWIGADEPEEIAQVKKEAPKTTSDLILPKTLDKFKDFEGEIPDISFEAIKRDLRSYPSEFKDRDFFEKNKDKWTVEVMDVSEHQIITDYLQRRKDRDKFFYFRYMDSKSKERYVLLYDVMNNRQLAMGATKVVDFQLPNNARTLSAQIGEYIDKIDNYVRDEAVEESEPAVQLKETKKEVKAMPANTKPKPKPEPKKVEEPKETVVEETPAVQTPELAVPPTAKPTPEITPAPAPPAPLPIPAPAPPPAPLPIQESQAVEITTEQGDSQ